MNPLIRTGMLDVICRLTLVQYATLVVIILIVLITIAVKHYQLVGLVGRNVEAKEFTQVIMHFYATLLDGQTKLQKMKVLI